MTQSFPARQPGSTAKPGDIVTSAWSSSGAMWRVEAVLEVPSYRYGVNSRTMLDLVSLSSGRTDRRGAAQVEVLSAEEVAARQAKRTPKPDYREELIAALEGLLRARRGDKLRQEADPLFSTRANDAADAEYVDDEIASLEKRIAELKGAAA